MEIFLIILPSLLGAGFGGLISWLVTRWSVRNASKQRLAEGKFDLARRLIRDKSAGTGTIEALNEIPAFFGDDQEVMEAFADARPVGGKQADMTKVLELIALVGRRSGLPSSLSVEDLAGGFTAGPPSNPSSKSPRRGR